MWNALRSDLKEFVSSVTEEGANALAVIDSKLQVEDGDDMKRLVLDDDGNLLNPKDCSKNEEKGWEERLRLPIPIDEEFQFDMESHKEEISEVLIYNPEIAQIMKDLVPKEMEEAEFWRRYSYCCEKMADEERQKQEEMENSMETEDIGLKIEKGWKNLGNLVEGAVRAVAPVDGRPPFVMNTAVSDDGLEEDGRHDEEVEFSSTLEDQVYKISQMEEELSLLQQTVEMQRMEIATLNSKLENSSTTKEEELKISLAEKNVEIAALKANFNDIDGDSTKGEKIAEQAIAIHRLEKKIDEDEKEIETLKQKINGGGSDTNNIMEVKEKLEQSEKLNEQLKKDIEILKSNGQGENNPDIQTLKNDLAKLQSELSKAESRAKAAEDLANSLGSNPSKNSPSSFSSGEKIIPDSNEKNVDDDWGEDWGDDV